jgi:hypothetical protein
MKSSKAEIHSRVHALPEVRFEDHILTSFSGIALFQALLSRLGLKQKLRECFRGVRVLGTYGLAVVFLQLVLHIIVGFRRLRDRDYYCDDPLLCRVLGVRRLPDVSTISRTLSAATPASVDRVRDVAREMVLARLKALRPARVTLDFDGSVLSTRGHAEGTAIGYNRKRRGARSYYPLFCTVAQTGQFLDFHHRPGNVHDSNGAFGFMNRCVDAVQGAVPAAQLESRIDGAFFDQDLLAQLHTCGVEFSVSLPFARFPELKQMVENRRHWHRLDDTWSYFETTWRPSSWDPTPYRVLFVRKRFEKPIKGPLQLDLFEPRDRDYDYRAVMSNKIEGPHAVVRFHHGRGGQEGILGESKSHAQLDYVPCRRLVANQLYTAASVLAHNLGRELQMATRPPERRTTPTRMALWIFDSLGSLRNRLVRRAGKLARPAGKLTLTVSANGVARDEFATYLDALRPAA